MIDLNADIRESFGWYVLGNDELIVTRKTVNCSLNSMAAGIIIDIIIAVLTETPIVLGQFLPPHQKSMSLAE